MGSAASVKEGTAPGKQRRVLNDPKGFEGTIMTMSRFR